MISRSPVKNIFETNTTSKSYLRLSTSATIYTQLPKFHLSGSCRSCGDTSGACGPCAQSVETESSYCNSHGDHIIIIYRWDFGSCSNCWRTVDSGYCLRLWRWMGRGLLQHPVPARQLLHRRLSQHVSSLFSRILHERLSSSGLYELPTRILFTRIRQHLLLAVLGWNILKCERR